MNTVGAMANKEKVRVKSVGYTMSGDQLGRALAEAKKRRKHGDKKRAEAKKKRDQGEKAEFSDLLGDKDKPEIVNEFNGACAELVFALLAGVEPIFTKDCDYDCVVDKNNVDVKQDSYNYGLCVLCNKVGKDIDIFVLAIGTAPHFEICGWANYDDIIQRKNIIKKKSGLNYHLPVQALRPIDTLLINVRYRWIMI